MTLHFSHIGLTDARTFIAPRIGNVSNEETGACAQETAQRRPIRVAAAPGRLAVCARIVYTDAAAGWTPLSTTSCQGVRMRGPSPVMATVCSKWAASDPSWEYTAQLSEPIRT